MGCSTRGQGAEKREHKNREEGARSWKQEALRRKQGPGIKEAGEGSREKGAASSK